jgi:hypothetical protein
MTQKSQPYPLGQLPLYMIKIKSVLVKTGISYFDRYDAYDYGLHKAQKLIIIISSI